MNHNLFTNISTYFSVLVVFHQILDIYWMKCTINHDRSITELHWNLHTCNPYPFCQLSSLTFWHLCAPEISNLDSLFHMTCVCHVVLLNSFIYWNLFSFAFLYKIASCPEMPFPSQLVPHVKWIFDKTSFFALRKWPFAFHQLQTEFCIFHCRLQFEHHIFKIQS